MSRKLVLVPPRENVSNPEPPGDKATFCLGIGGPVEVGTDVAPHYMVRKPGRFFETCANAKIPSETEMVLDILKSSDQGAHWYSIFPDGSRIAIPAGSTQQVRITRYAATRTMQWQ